MKALVGAFYQEKALVGAFSVIVQLHRLIDLRHYLFLILLAGACFQNDRDRLREFLVSWLQLTARQQPWHTRGMSWAEIIWGHFYSLDTNK